jgi:hypothetical protein
MLLTPNQYQGPTWRRLPAVAAMANPLAYELDRAHPMALGLRSFVIPASLGGPLIDMAKPTRQSTTVSTAGTAVRFPYGHSVQNAIIGVNAECADLNPSGPRWSVFTLFFALNTAGSFQSPYSFINYVSEGSNQGWDFNVSGNILFNSMANNGSGSYRLDSGVAVAANGTYAACGTVDGTTRRVYVDGTQRATTTNNLTPAANTTTNYIFGTNHNANNVFQTYIGAMWDRCLDASEVRSLSFDPYQMLKPRTDTFVAASVPIVFFPPVIEGSGRVTGAPSSQFYSWRN